MRRSVLLTLLLLFAISGCATHMVSRKGVSASFKPNSRVAVLPFENLSGQEQVAAKVTEYFNTLLADESKFTLVENGNIYEVMRKHRIRSGSLLTSLQIDSLAVSLQIDYLLTGSVLEYEEYDDDYLGKIPQVSFNTRMIDCSSHNTVWAAVSHGSGDKAELLFGIGAVRSADQLAERMVQNVVGTVAGLFK
jgi:TolB-like protein